MNISIILAHPNKKSFNRAVAETAAGTARKNGHKVFFHDLYSEKFDPLITVEEFKRDAKLPKKIARLCEEISSSEGLVIVHPNWWGQPPAILKGWIDRVLRPGVAYRFQETDKGEGLPIGLLKVKHALIFNTSNTPKVREKLVFGDPLESLWKTGMMEFCGVRKFTRRMFGIVVTSSKEQRAAWLEEVEALTAKAFGKAKRVK